MPATPAVPERVPHPTPVGTAMVPGLAPGLLTLLADMHEAVTTYVRQRHGEGVSAQCVLLEVEALVRGAVDGDATREMADLLGAHAVRWTMSAYHARDAAALNTQPGTGHRPPPS